MDVIAAHEHGFTNVVASMGTAVTGQQLDALARQATAGGVGTIVLCLDSDAAGEAATMRALEAVTAELSTGRRRGIEVKVARPDGGKDPDEAIRSDPDSWRVSLSEADPLLDYLIVAKSKLNNLESGQGIADFANSIAPLIYNIPNDYDRDRYWATTAKIAGVTEQRLKSIVDKPRGGSRRPRAGRGNSSQLAGSGRISSQQASDVLDTSTGDRLEELGVALPEHRQRFDEAASAKPGCIRHGHGDDRRRQNDHQRNRPLVHFGCSRVACSDP